ncbi:hypothetical protein ACI3KS_10395 [Microbacterium sp. ZW T5_45]|uniref:hypothetical protein n=1 Tax=Microbacterium sp. ZW T5_45 TaxID=3378080 RepID=UPI0038544134
MTDPQLPPPYGSAPAVPPAYPGAPQPPSYGAPSGAQASPFPAPVGAGAPFPPAPQAPPGAYQVPVGGYAAPEGGYALPPAAAPQKSGLLGILALVFALLAAVASPVVAGIAGFEIGTRIPSGFDTTDPNFLSVLSPARDQVLWAEIAFWAGTVLGLAGIVVGIMAIVKKQRRALGVVALILSVLGAGVYWIVLTISLSLGTANGLGA